MSAAEQDCRELLAELFRTAVAAAGPQQLGPFLPHPPAAGNLLIVAAGKAAPGMATVALAHYREHLPRDRISCLCIAKPGSGFAVSGFPPLRQLIEAGHPLPDAASASAAETALQWAAMARAGDLVLLLLSGGASSLMCAPVAGVSLDDKQQLTRALLRSGAPIDEINCVRKHLSRIKGGRLARAAAPARLVTLALSDVVGDDPAVIASGPSVADPTTLADARAIIDRYALAVPDSIAAALADPANETPKPGDAAFARTSWSCIASGATALAAAGDGLRQWGFEVVDLGDRIGGEARAVAADHARLALQLAGEHPGRRLAVLSGGELTVTVTGRGRGGPNQEYALALAIALALGGAPDICALAADTDGCDGGEGRPDDPAGALAVPSTLARARAKGLDPATFLANNDSGSFFAELGDLLTSGPTGTNVNDLRAILIGGLPEPYRRCGRRPADKGGV